MPSGLNPTGTGDAIASFVQGFGVVAGTPVTNAQLKAIWEGIITRVDADLANGIVAPSTFEVTGVQAGGSTVLVTGTGGGMT